MTAKLIPLVERRSEKRFSIRLPFTIITPTEAISAFTRDLSDTGVYFYVSSEDLDLVSQQFECRVEFPPEITMTMSRRMCFTGTLLRTEKRTSGEIGLAAKLCKVSALQQC